MKTECNDLDEKATVRNLISWSFFLKWNLTYTIH